MLRRKLPSTLKRPKTNYLGRDSSVGIATRYGLDGPGSNPVGGEIFRTRPESPCRPPSFSKIVPGLLLGSKAVGAWS
jgi:hypothetical protein